MPNPLTTDLTAALDTYAVTTLAGKDSLAYGFVRDISPPRKSMLSADIQAVALKSVNDNAGDGVVSGLDVTDHGASNSKVDIAAGVVLTGGVLVAVPAQSALATSDGKHIYYDQAAATTKSGSSTPSGKLELATVAVSAGDCTVTSTVLVLKWA